MESACASSAHPHHCPASKSSALELWQRGSYPRRRSTYGPRKRGCSDRPSWPAVAGQLPSAQGWPKGTKPTSCQIEPAIPQESLVQTPSSTQGCGECSHSNRLLPCGSQLRKRQRPQRSRSPRKTQPDKRPKRAPDLSQKLQPRESAPKR